jgi:hypothetical protein
LIETLAIRKEIRMSLPEQIQRQVTEAQEIIKQFEEGKPTNEAPAVPTDAVSAAPDNASAQQTQASAPPHGGEDENSPSYAQRWRSLQGSYNSAIQQNRQLIGRVQQLEQLLGTMQQAAPASAPAQGLPASAGQHVTDRDREDFGQDMIDFADRVAADRIAPLMEHIGKLERALQQVQGVVPAVQNVVARQQQSAEQQFFAELTRLIPAWEQINATQPFQAWLLNLDPMTGISRQTYLEDAQRRGDVQRVASIFNIWQQLSGNSQPAPSVTEQPSQPRTANDELARQVVPGRSLSAPAPSTSQPRTWSGPEITKFYSDVRRGVFKGKEAERNQIEADIFAAQREGRISRHAA